MTCLIITNPKICEFYEKNPNLQIESVNLLFIDLLNKLLLNNETSDIQSIINQFESKTTDMIQPICSLISASEQRIQNNISQINIPKIQSSNPSIPLLTTILNKLYTTSEVSHLPNKQIIGEPYNAVFLKRQGCAKVLIQDININANVNPDEIRQFIKNIEDNNCHGVYLSQNSGFCGKSNYHIEIHNRLVTVFVHNVEYNTDKIKIALDIIDHFSARLRELNYFNNNIDITIEKEVLDDINKEYQLFVHQKENLLMLIKENYRKIISQMEDFSFHSLDKYLSTKFSSVNVKQPHKCDLCKNFNAHNLKALAAHKRGCIRKNGAIKNIEVIA